MYIDGPYQGEVVALGGLLVELMVDDTLFLLVVRVEPDFTVRFGGVKGFEDIGWTWGEKMFGRDIFELWCIFARCC